MMRGIARRAATRVAASPRLLRMGVLAAFAAAALAGPAGGAEASAGATVAGGGGVTVDIALTAPVGFSIFTLDAPRRVIVDLPGVVWRGPPPEGAGAVASARAGLFTAGAARLAFDLEEPMRVVSAALASGEGGPLLRIRLAPTDADGFAAAAGAPPGAIWRAPVDAAPAPAPGEGFLLVIDPGHGGIDPGAVREGIAEKDIALAFGRDLADAARSRGMRAALTREEDLFLPLDERVRIARRAGADVFLSIHVNVLREGRASGAKVFTPAEETDDPADAAFAAFENGVDALAGVSVPAEETDIAAVLLDLTMRGARAESRRLGDALVSGMGAEVRMIHRWPHRQAGFRVLKAPDVPSALIELGFMDNPRDLADMTDPEWRAQAAGGVLDGIEAWRSRSGAEAVEAPAKDGLD